MARVIVLGAVLISFWFIYFCDWQGKDLPHQGGGLVAAVEYAEPKVEEIGQSVTLEKSIQIGRYVAERGPVVIFFDLVN